MCSTIWVGPAGSPPGVRVSVTSSSVALLSGPSGNLVPFRPSPTHLLPLGRESTTTPPFGDLPSGCRSSSPKLPLLLGVHVTLLHSAMQSLSQLTKLKETPSPCPHGYHSARLLWGLPYHLQGLLYHVRCATIIGPLLGGESTLPGDSPLDMTYW